MITVLLIVHGLLAVTLLGAITHQALSVAPGAATAGSRSFLRRFRSVNSAALTRRSFNGESKRSSIAAWKPPAPQDKRS